MHTGQIRQFLRMDQCTKDVWRGFVARDSEPLDPPARREWRKKDDDLYIINTDVANGPGKHWCVGFTDNTNGTMEFFDSYGLPPVAYGLDRLYPRWIQVHVNSRVVQSFDTLTCGYHCLFFAYCRSRGMGMDRIIGMYTDDLKRNDRMVSRFVLQHGSMYALERRVM
jgi:hypothetical protein